MPTDLEIAQAATPLPIAEIAARLGLGPDDIIPYGHHKAKLFRPPAPRDGAKLILVTAINPTPAGEGKTTTTVGLADGLRHIGVDAMACLREPSLGPCFGVKGGATGGGYAQVIPMEDINLHFSGDSSTPSCHSAHNAPSRPMNRTTPSTGDAGVFLYAGRVAMRRVMT